MRDNEFEKGVQEKMGEFRLPPSAPVWVEVERRIRERKRRRILIFWFCLAGLLTAGLGSWWIFQNGNQPVMVRTTAGVKQSDTTIPGREKIEPNSVVSAPEKNNTGTTKPQSENTEAQTNLNAEVTLKSSREIEKRSAPLPEKKQTGRLEVKPTITGKQIATQFSTGSGKKSAAPKKEVKGKSVDAQKIMNPDLAKNNEEARAKGEVPSVPVIATVTTKAVDSPVIVQSTSVVALPADTFQQAKTGQAQVVTAAAKSRIKKGKWQTGLLFAFGESKLTEGGLNVFLNKSMNFDQLQSGSTSGNTGSSTYNNQSFADSISLKGPAFHAGIFAKHKSGKKTAFSAGLNFAYYSGKQRVGALVDSVRQISSPFNTRTGDGFYRSGSSARYTNRYYFIQLPLLLHWQINKGVKGPPMEWENGIVPSFMVGNRALVYDRAGQIFFRDKSVYNKLSLVYQTGFTATFASRTRHPLTAGLFYNYHFSRLQKTNPPDFNHLGSFGIQFRWLLKK